MRHIAILTCLEACQVCTGAGCLRAWNSRSRYFAPYAGEEVQLEAFLHCNGCGRDPAGDDGMAEKLNRLTSLEVDTVHLGVCCKKHGEERLCPTISQLRTMLEDRGIRVVFGTH